jgi:hypothetical protein
VKRIAVTTVFVVAGCGGTQRGADPCPAALRRGPPPAAIECPAGTEPRAVPEPSGPLDRVPHAGGESARAGIAERRWCEGAAGPHGPYLAVDAGGRVLESGAYDQTGRLAGDWIVWRPGGRPAAVTRYRDGTLQASRGCEL